MGVRNYLIEGLSGTGKTSVCDELQRRGYHAIHGDRELTYSGDPATGQPTEGGGHEHHLWEVEKVKALTANHDEAVSFFCGGSRNFAKFIHLFDAVFVLEVDLDTLNRRLDERPDSEWGGGKPTDRELIARWHQSKADVPRDGISIEATAPIPQVVDSILRHCEAGTQEPEVRRGQGRLLGRPGRPRGVKRAGVGLGSVQAGRVVVLNGTSSAGKSTLARELQSRSLRPLLLVGVDAFLSMLPERYFGDPDGFEIVTLSSSPPSRRVRPGPIGRGLLAGFHSSVAAFARAGLDVVVDDVLLDKWCLVDYLRALAGLDVLLVGVRCDVELAARREAERGDRTIGFARGHHASAHEHALYDLDVDTSTSTIVECAAAIEQALESPPARRAFDVLVERREKRSSR